MHNCESENTFNSIEKQSLLLLPICGSAPTCELGDVCWLSVICGTAVCVNATMFNLGLQVKVSLSKP